MILVRWILFMHSFGFDFCLLLESRKLVPQLPELSQLGLGGTKYGVSSSLPSLPMSTRTLESGYDSRLSSASIDGKSRYGHARIRHVGQALMGRVGLTDVISSSLEIRSTCRFRNRISR